MSKRVLFIYPWPLDEANGARVVLLAYARALVRRGMTVDCFAPGHTTAKTDDSGLYLGVFDRVFGPATAARTLQTLLNAGGAGCMDQALPSQHGCEPSSMFAAATIAATGRYDLIGVHYARLHAIRPLLPPTVPVVMFTYDLDAIVAEQESVVFGTPPSRYTLAMEAERVAGFDAVTTVGSHDRDRLRQAVPALPVVSAPIPVPLTPLPARETSGKTILLMSSSAIFHELSLAWFLTHAWPLVTAKHADARLILAGRICDTARRFGADKDTRIELLGTIDHPREALIRADVVIAPYYFGDGVKLKVLEALAYGLPVVTTTPGLSNTELVADRDVLVADDGPGFAAAITKLLEKPAHRARLSQNALRFIGQRHSEAVADRALQNLAETLIGRPPPAISDQERDPSRTQQFVSHLQMAVAAALDVPAPASDSTAPSHLVTQLRVLLPWAVHRVRAAGVKSVAIYGAGTHTRMVLPMWRALDGAVPTAVVVSGQPSEPFCGGLPVIPLDEFNPRGTDAVLLSSHGYEHAMTAAWQARFPHIPVFSIWSPPNDAGAGPLAIPTTAETIPVATPYAQTLHR